MKGTRVRNRIPAAAVVVASASGSVRENRQRLQFFYCLPQSDSEEGENPVSFLCEHFLTLSLCVLFSCHTHSQSVTERTSSSPSPILVPVLLFFFLSSLYSIHTHAARKAGGAEIPLLLLLLSSPEFTKHIIHDTRTRSIRE